MVRRVFFKLWLGFTLILLVLAVLLEGLIHAKLGVLRTDAGAGHLMTPFVWGVLLFSFFFCTLLCLRASRRFSRNDDATVRFAGRVASGDFTARISAAETAGTLETIEALNVAAESLGQMYRTLETSRRELTALLDSMEEAVIAITPDGQVSWSNAVFEAISQGPVRYGRALVHTIRDPDVLDAVERALREARGLPRARDHGCRGTGVPGECGADSGRRRGVGTA